jgi:hypothetical protein
MPKACHCHANAMPRAVFARHFSMAARQWHDASLDGTPFSKLFPKKGRRTISIQRQFIFLHTVPNQTMRRSRARPF